MKIKEFLLEYSHKKEMYYLFEVVNDEYVFLEELSDVNISNSDIIVKDYIREDEEYFITNERNLSYILSDVQLRNDYDDAEFDEDSYNDYEWFND